MTKRLKIAGRRFCHTAYAVVGCALAAGGASAQTLPSQLTTFASYAEQPGSGAQSFEYTDTFGPSGAPSPTAATGTFSIASNTQVNFQYLVPSSFTGNQSQIPAYLSFSGTSVGAASVSGPIVIQTVENVSATFTAVTPDSSTGKTNLLSLNFASGTLFFDDATGAATFQASALQAVAGPPGIADYKSDFLDFNNPTAASQYFKSEQFSLALSAVNSPGGSGNPGPVVDANGTIESFTADSAGTFSSNPAPLPPSTVPDANPLLLTWVGMGLCGVGRWRRSSDRSEVPS